MPDYHYLFYVITFLELFTSLMATIYIEKYKSSKEYYFLFFLWFTFFLELIAGSLGYIFSINNQWIYNIFMTISFSFYLYWYQSILKKRGFRKIVVIFVTVFLCVAIWNIVFQSPFSFHKYTFVTGALLTMICTIFHFWQLLNSDEILEVKYKLSFWISTGLLLFNMGMIPMMLLSKHLNFSEIQYYIIIITLNIILYGCYSIGFLWTKEKYNRS